MRPTLRYNIHVLYVVGKSRKRFFYFKLIVVGAEPWQVDDANESLRMT